MQSGNIEADDLKEQIFLYISKTVAIDPSIGHVALVALPSIHSETFFKCF